MKTIAILLLALSFGLVTGCAEHSPVEAQTTVASGDAMLATLNADLGSVPVGTLTQAQIDGLVHMREEEKLARDVYDHFASVHGTAIFATIARSEALHMSAVKLLLDRYGIADPVGSNGAGIFTDAHFTALYSSLTAQGDASVAAALGVGATIEDLDIKDLLDLVAAGLPQDVTLVYTNLTRASENHLRSFVAQLRAAGATYTPQFISQAQFDGILAVHNGRGHGRRP